MFKTIVISKCDGGWVITDHDGKLYTRVETKDAAELMARIIADLDKPKQIKNNRPEWVDEFLKNYVNDGDVSEEEN